MAGRTEMYRELGLTVYGCWRQWGLRGYRVGRYLRFRARHVEEWFRNREA